MDTSVSLHTKQSAKGSVAIVPCRSSGNGDCPRLLCPAASVDVVVRSSADAGAIDGVQATLTGPTTVTLSCAHDSGPTSCDWRGTIVPGSYTLQITAPGFTATSVAATITVPPQQPCGCASATIQPSEVTLDPS
jgi:hypothetical protein